MPANTDPVQNVVILLEDSPAFLLAMTDMLHSIFERRKQRGGKPGDLKLLKFRTLDEAMHAVMTEAVDLVIADVKISRGGLEGLQLAAKAKHIGIPTIVISGVYELSVDIVPAGRFLQKPFNAEQMEEMINITLPLPPPPP